MTTGQAAGAALGVQVESAALALGFDLVGITHAGADDDTRYIHEWLERGFGGEMHYLARRADERADPQRVLPGARSIVAVALDYDSEAEEQAESETEADAETGSRIGARGRVARYAQGDDYHDVMLDRLRALGAALEPLAGRPVSWRAYVDTGPVGERVIAARAGLGWIGKNTCLIHPELGSFVFLGVLLCDLDLADSAPDVVHDQCGSCRACLDACPTDAFVEAGVLDATRCIAYTTIELQSVTPEAQRSGQGDHVFGCDVCQDVCPWNQRRGRRRPGDPLGLRARLAPRDVWTDPHLIDLLELDEGAFREASRRSPVRRAGHPGLLRSALLAAGNSGDRDLAAAVETLCAHHDPTVAEHARWALGQLDVGPEGGC